MQHVASIGWLAAKTSLVRLDVDVWIGCLCVHADVGTVTVWIILLQSVMAQFCSLSSNYLICTCIYWRAYCNHFMANMPSRNSAGMGAAAAQAGSMKS